MDRKLSRKLLGSALAVAALVFAGSAAQAGNSPSSGNSVQVVLTSTVQNACSIKTDTTGAVSLGDVSATAFNGTIANLTETCNDLAGGYTVKLTSANAGNGTSLYLKGGNTNNATQIPYTLSYYAAVTLVGGTATIHTGNTTPPTGNSQPLTLTTAPGSYTADTYGDTLTITLAAS